MAAKKKTVPKATRIRRLVRKCHEAWSLLVRTRDGKCLRCGATKSLAAHHWVVSDHRSRQDRFNPSNGISLCYGCHIHVIHKDASYANSVDLYNLALDAGIPEQDILDILSRVGTDSLPFKEEDLEAKLDWLTKEKERLGARIDE